MTGKGKSLVVSPSSSSHIVAALSKCTAMETPSLPSPLPIDVAASLRDSDGDIMMLDLDGCSDELPLKTLPGPLLGRLWPATRTLVGMQTCRWLREELLAHAEGATMQRKSIIAVSSAQICADLSRLPHTKILLRQSRCSPPIAPEFALALRSGLTAAMPALAETLVHLDLARSHLGDTGLKMLATGLEACSALAYVDMEANSITDEGARCLAQGLEGCTGLAHMSVRDNKIADSGAHALARTIAQNPKLQTLDLGMNEIGDDGTASLALALCELKQLVHLNLSWNSIGQEGARRLASIFGRCTPLTRLYLGRNKIGDVGVGFLAEALPACTSIEHLDLGRNDVGDFGAMKLAAVLVACPSLSFLDLGRNRIRDDGEEELSRMRRQRDQGLQINFGGQRSLTNYT